MKNFPMRKRPEKELGYGETDIIKNNLLRMDEKAF